jgi:galactose oxidase
MPDGRIFSGGGGLCGTCKTNHPDGQIFTPLYLLSSTGGSVGRPGITAPTNGAELTNGVPFTVTSSVKLKSIAILRLGSATHAVNNDQRRIELCGPAITACSSGTRNTVLVPADPGIAVPGARLTALGA